MGIYVEIADQDILQDVFVRCREEGILDDHDFAGFGLGNEVPT